MKNLLIATAALILVGLVYAGRPEAGAFATVTFTAQTGETWVDSGIIVRDFEQPSPVPGYNLRTIYFTDHANGYHLDEGTVEVVYGTKP